VSDDGSENFALGRISRRANKRHGSLVYGAQFDEQGITVWFAGLGVLHAGRYAKIETAIFQFLLFHRAGSDLFPNLFFGRRIIQCFRSTLHVVSQWFCASTEAVTYNFFGVLALKLPQILEHAI